MRKTSFAGSIAARYAQVGACVGLTVLKVNGQRVRTVDEVYHAMAASTDVELCFKFVECKNTSSLSSSPKQRLKGSPKQSLRGSLEHGPEACTEESDEHTAVSIPLLTEE